MGCLFRFDKVKGVIINPDAVQLTEHIKLLDEKGQLFLIYWLDYESIYAQHPNIVRMRMAMRKVYSSDDIDISTPLWKEAIWEYKALQYDSDRETERVLTDKIEMVQHELKDAMGNKAVSDALKTIKVLSEERSSIRLVIDRQESEIQLKGPGEVLSFIEKYQRAKEKKKQDDKKQEQEQVTKKVKNVVKA